jgi:hypothetical protein
MKERAIITPVLIRQVQLMLAGGATGKEAAEITGTSEGTISRIKKAGFDYDTFVKNTEARRKTAEVPEKKPEQLELQGGVDYQVQVNEQLAGQMKMDLPEEKTEMSDTVKMMRFLAGRLDTMEKSQVEELGYVIERLGRICDYLGQILRVIGPEGGRKA